MLGISAFSQQAFACCKLLCSNSNKSEIVRRSLVFHVVTCFIYISWVPRDLSIWEIPHTNLSQQDVWHFWYEWWAHWCSAVPRAGAQPVQQLGHPGQGEPSMWRFMSFMTLEKLWPAATRPGPYTDASLSSPWQLRIIRIAKEEEIASKSINEVEPLRCKATPRQLRPGGLPCLSIFELISFGMIFFSVVYQVHLQWDRYSCPTYQLQGTPLPKSLMLRAAKKSC